MHTHKRTAVWRVRNLYQILKDAMRGFFEDDAIQLAAAFSFYAVSAIPPLLVGLVQMLSLLSTGPQAEDNLLYQARWLLGARSLGLLHAVLEQSHSGQEEGIAGMILLGVAPCTAMVFVWSQLTKGDANYTLVQVSINDLIMVFAFAPLAAFLLGVTDVVVPWETLFLSVILYVVVPLAAGYVTRRAIDTGEPEAVAQFTGKLKPFSILGLLATVVLLFGFQAQTILSKPGVIALIAVPLILQSYGIFLIAYGWSYLWKVPHEVAAPAALIGTSNFFELAVAVAISLFGLQSGAALATVVGVLVEVPVMLSLVALANRTRPYFVTTI